MSNKCIVPICDREIYNKNRKHNLCRGHLNRLHKYGDIRSDIPLKVQAPHGTGFIDRSGYHQRKQNGKNVFVHRVIMEEHLGRKLEKHENVHHINGDRSDNRLANLELWSTLQPYGQRVEDKIAYAIEILSLYAGDQMIRKQGSKYVLYSKDGSKKLGTHPSRASAQKQEAAIEISKHKRGKGK